MANRVILYSGKVSGYQILKYLAMINTSIIGPINMHPDIFKT